MKNILLILLFLVAFLESKAEPYFEVYNTRSNIRINCKSDSEFYITRIYKYEGVDTLDFDLTDHLLIKKSNNFLDLKDEWYEIESEKNNLFKKKLVFKMNIEYFYNGNYNICEIKIIRGIATNDINELYNSSYKFSEIYDLNYSGNYYKNILYDKWLADRNGEYPLENATGVLKPGRHKIQPYDTRLIELKYSNTSSVKNFNKIIINSSKIELKFTGTTFAITTDGFVVTNNHVIEGAKELKIRGINGDMKKSYNAIVISKDEKNDLAILKIDDPNFTSLGNVPINIVQKPIEVGSSIFVLGYPMISAMGDEIKLTDGKISSRTGYQGDVSTYQISAPIQPGNSGGPLFDEEGNLIGITSSGITSADNVGYAIKTSYLMNMFDALQDYPNLTKTNTISKKKLPEKIKVLQKFIYIIENYQ